MSIKQTGILHAFILRPVLAAGAPAQSALPYSSLYLDGTVLADPTARWLMLPALLVHSVLFCAV